MNISTAMLGTQELKYSVLKTVLRFHIVSLSSRFETVLRSGSMEPAFQRGDILFLNNDDSPLRAGEVVVFKIKDREIPIVHRIMNVHEK